MYVNDRRDIKAYDVAADGSLSNVRTVHDDMGSAGTPGNGNPDGMECDALSSADNAPNHGAATTRYAR